MAKEDSVNKFIELRPIYKNLCNKLYLIIQEVLELNKINYHAITYRAKTIESFSGKAKKAKYDDPLNQLTDLAGVRIIGYVEDDVIKISNLIEELFEIDLENSLDKSKELGVDKVGYKSVHFVGSFSKSRLRLPEYARFKGLKFEIQIRTILQHAWAEIEHDKNYKFSGVLPPEIQRRFKVLAGTLELVDREFNLISKEIDEYSKNVKESAEKGNLDIEINSTSLKQYLETKFSNFVDKGILEPNFYKPENEPLVIEELRNFGINSLSELDKIIGEDIDKYLTDEINNYLGLLRLIMMIFDSDKYFSKSYNGQWSKLVQEHEDKLEELGINVDRINENLSTEHEKYRK